MPADLHEAFTESGKDGIMSIQDWSNSRHDAYSPIPNLRNAGSKVTAELAILGLPELAENYAALVALHAQDGGEVLDQEDGVAVGGVSIAVLYCRAELLKQAGFLVPVKPAEEGIFSDIAKRLHLLQSTSTH